ncbi:MAG: AAA family ATPase [Pseudomonadaceae bacterium]|nr:AAA family ATPase [Pseudomonadaceae bacterium]
MSTTFHPQSEAGIDPDREPLSVSRHIPALALDWQATTPDEQSKILEGSLLFGDISGFTALAERLAQQGRRGGEELVETLGQVFTAMLDTAATRGGDMLKFGGDALLLFFQGPDHTEHAASTAVAMRQILKEAASIRTSVGSLKLSMSIGIHSGGVHFFMVGTSSRELIVTGPVLDRVIELENAANAGEVLISQATAQCLTADATNLGADGFHRLKWRVPRSSPLSMNKLTTRADQASTQLLIPQVLEDHLGRAIPEPEHRVACIAFVGFSGTDRLLVEAGASGVAEALHETLSAAQECLDAEGVTLLAVDIDQGGGKLFLASGVPSGHEDDEGAMLRALRRLMNLQLPLPLRAGVNRGHVFVAEIGTTRRAAYSAMGDTTNTAARIMGKAQSGRIYVHPSVLDECLVLYKSVQSGPFAFKGKAEKVVLYDVGDEIGPRKREGLEINDFIGRASALTQLKAAVRDSQRGRGSVILLAGPAGIGKTRLINEALRSFERPSSIWMTADPYGATTPYESVHKPLRHFLGLEGSSPAELAQQLRNKVSEVAAALTPFLSLVGDVLHIPIEPGPAVQALDPSFLMEKTAAVMIDLLVCCTQGPQIVVVDAAQWVDDASANLLNRLSAQTTDAGWLMLAAGRAATPEEKLTALEGKTVFLEPLPDPDVRTIVELASEAAPFRTQDVDRIVARASGNPMFALELVKTARDLGSMVNIPETLEAALSAQIDALDGPARQFLRYAAVLGRRFEVTVLEQLISSLGILVDPSVVSRLEDFITPDGDGWLQFKNGVCRDVIYEGISFQNRSSVHQKIADILEQREQDPVSLANELALHYALAGNAKKTWRYAMTAAQQAAAAYANFDGAKLYEIALEASSRLPDVSLEERRNVWRELSVLRERAGLFDAAKDALRQALELCGDNQVARAELICMRGILKDRTRSFSAALRDMHLGQKLLIKDKSQNAGRCRAELMAWAANIRYGQDQLEGARALAIEAEQEARRSGNEGALARTLSIRGSADLMLRGPEDASALHAALERYESLGNSRMQANVRSNLGIFCAIAGQWTKAAEWMKAARDNFLTAGDDSSAVFPALDLAEMLLKQRKYPQAETAILQTIRLARANQLDEGVDEGELLLAQLYLAEDKLENAQALLQRIETSFSTTGQQRKTLETRLVGVAILSAQGKLEVALAGLDDIVARAADDHESLTPTIALHRATTLRRLGQFSDAERQLLWGLDYAVSSSMPYEEALLREARILLRAQQSSLQEPEDASRVHSIITELGIRELRAVQPSHQ